MLPKRSFTQRWNWWKYQEDLTLEAFNWVGEYWEGLCSRRWSSFLSTSHLITPPPTPYPHTHSNPKDPNPGLSWRWTNPICHTADIYSSLHCACACMCVSVATCVCGCICVRTGLSLASEACLSTACESWEHRLYHCQQLKQYFRGKSQKKWGVGNQGLPTKSRKMKDCT